MCKKTIRILLITFTVFILCHQSTQAQMEVHESTDSFDEQAPEKQQEIDQETFSEKQQMEVSVQEEEKEEVHDEQEEGTIPEEIPNMETEGEEQVDTNIPGEEPAPTNPVENQPSPPVLTEKVTEEASMREPISETEVPITGPDSAVAQPSDGLLDIELLGNTSLTASHSNSGGQEVITLAYRGYGVLNASLLQNTYAIFQLPPELANVIQSRMSASYDVPRLGLLGIVLRNQGNFQNDEIQIQGNQVILNFKQILAVNLLSSSHYDFKLTFTLDALPPAPNGEYLFRAQATSQIVDLSLLSGGNVAHATLAAPVSILEFSHVPAELRFEETPMNSIPITVKRQESDWALEVRDTRGSGSEWRVTAQIESPLTSVNNPTKALPDALIYTNTQGSSIPFSSEPVEVFSGTTGTDPITKVRWAADQGPLIRVIPTDAVQGDYETTITWTLVDAP